MIDVDPREGSAALCGPLQRLGLDARTRTLRFADLAWNGNGPTGPIRVGVEFKQFSELLDSITTGRFVGYQLPGLVKDYPARYLLIEGVWKADPKTGLAVVPRRVQKGPGRRWTTTWVPAGYHSRRSWMYADIEEWLNGLPIRVLKTGQRADTLHTIFGLVKWWEKPWHKHAALKVIYNGKTGTPSATDYDDEFGGGFGTVATMTVVSPGRSQIASIPHVGWEYSLAAENRFGGLWGACMASVDEWAELRSEGEAGARARPRIGRRRAQKIYNAIRGRSAD